MLAFSSGRNKVRSGTGSGGLLTVGEFLTSWLDGKQRLRASTTVGYRIHVDRHIRPVLGELPLADLSLADLQAFYAGLRDQGSALRRRKDPRHPVFRSERGSASRADPGCSDPVGRVGDLTNGVSCFGRRPQRAVFVVSAVLPPSVTMSAA